VEASTVGAGSRIVGDALRLQVIRRVSHSRLAELWNNPVFTQKPPHWITTITARFGQWFTVGALVLAALGFYAWWPDVRMAAQVATAVLIIACPCALTLAAPITLGTTLGTLGRAGVYLKQGAVALDLSRVDTIAFDKTGTLTAGELAVAGVETVPGVTRAEVIAAAAAVDAHSSHPVGVAVVAQARHDGVAVPSVTGVRARSGLGVEGRVDGRDIVVGNARLMALHGIDMSAAPPGAAGARVFVSIAGRLAGALSLVDRPRPQARDALDLLRRAGVRRIAMLTGDERGVAERVAADVGVDEYQAAMMPDQKHEAIGRLRKAYGPVAMVGDGINDAPALAAADVGIAMGAVGSDVALETADVALMSDELLKLPFALRLARATLRNVKTNVAVSIALKAVFLVAAITGHATLWMAVLADTGASVIVVANALRLLRAR